MPVIREYKRQIGSLNQQIGGRRATAADFGGDRGLVGVGKALGTVANDVQKQAERRDLSTLHAELARARSELTTELREQERTGAVNEPEFLGNFTGQLKERLEALSENMTTGLGRQTAGARGAALGADFRQIAFQTKAAAEGQLAKTNYREALNTNRNTVLSDPLQADSILQEAISILNDPAGPYARLSEKDRRELLTQTRRGLTLSEVQGYIENISPEVAKQLLLGGKWDAHIDADAKASLMRLADQAISKNTEIAEDDLRLQIDRVIKEGGNPLGLIRGGVERELFSSESAQALRNFYNTFVERKRKVDAAQAAFRAGNEIAFHPIESDIKREAAETWIAERMQDYNKRTPEQRKQTIGEVVRKGVRMDYMFSGMKALLSVTPHGESFGRAVDTYRSLEVFDPYYASKYVREDQRTRFAVYENAVRGGAAEEQALEMARSIGTEAIGKTKQFLNTEEGKTVVDDLRTKLNDGPWLSEVINVRFAVDATLERAKTMLAANPSADVESIVNSARASFEAENVVVNNAWIPRAFADGIPFDEMENVMTGLLTRLPEALRAQKLPVLEGAYVLAPDMLSDRDKRLQVFDPTGFPVPGLRFGANDMQKEFRRLKANEFDREQIRLREVSTWGGV